MNIERIQSTSDLKQIRAQARADSPEHGTAGQHEAILLCAGGG